MPWVIVFPLLDADGDPIAPSSPDSERSLNGDTIADCTNEAVQIASPGSAAAIADAIWDEVMSGHATDGTFGFAIAFLQKLLRNKIITNPLNGTFTIYDDDDTVLLSGNLWENAAGGVAYRGRGAERRDRLT